MLQQMVKPPRHESALFFRTAPDQVVHLCCQVSESCFHEALQLGAGELEGDGAVCYKSTNQSPAENQSSIWQIDNKEVKRQQLTYSRYQHTAPGDDTDSHIAPGV